ncbi:group 2 glycosyl transferase [Prevotella sp. MGM1]|nr:group 2 glycosyl transferase [Prevotella sp. MGM1]
MTPVDIGTHHVKTVYTPREAKPQSLAAGQHLEIGHLVSLGSVRIFHHHVKQHATGRRMTVEHIHCTFQRIA